jgi:hypothetical protein
MPYELNPTQYAVLAAVCDTIVPAIDRDADPDGFWGRKATDIGVEAGIAELMATMPVEQAGGLAELLDGLGALGFVGASQASREQLLRNVSLMGPLAAAGVQGLIAMTLFIAYGAPDPATGQNPNWRRFGYPGPISAPPQVDKRIVPRVPEGEE